MFVHLLRKELLHHLLEFRFIAVLVLSVALSLLSVLVGQRNYHRELQEFNAVYESNRTDLRQWIEEGRFDTFSSWGYRWNRPPEALSPVVYGLSGVLGQEVRLHFEYVPEFEGSPFETDALHAIFGALDFALIVQIVLSLCVLLVSYDAICGEKADGTLRLYASFPASKVSIAAAKLVGSTTAVLIPFVLSFLVVMAAMALSPETELAGEDWARLAGLMAIFALYLLVFAAFGLLVSAIIHDKT